MELLISLLALVACGDGFALSSAAARRATAWRAIAPRWTSALSYKPGRIKIAEWAETADGEIIGTLRDARVYPQSELDEIKLNMPETLAAAKAQQLVEAGGRREGKRLPPPREQRETRGGGQIVTRGGTKKKGRSSDDDGGYDDE